MTVEIQDAEHQLAELAASAVNGEDVILLANGKPLVKLVSLESEKPRRQLGCFDGMYNIPDDFDTMFDKEIDEMFFGGAGQ